MIPLRVRCFECSQHETVSLSMAQIISVPIRINAIYRRPNVFLYIHSHSWTMMPFLKKISFIDHWRKNNIFVEIYHVLFTRSFRKLILLNFQFSIIGSGWSKWDSMNKILNEKKPVFLKIYEDFVRCFRNFCTAWDLIFWFILILIYFFFIKSERFFYFL